MSLSVLAAVESVPLVDVVQPIVARSAKVTRLTPRNDPRLRRLS